MTRREDFELLRRLVEGMAPRPEQVSALRLFEFYDEAIETLNHVKNTDEGICCSEDYNTLGAVRSLGGRAREVLAKLDEEIAS